MRVKVTENGRLYSTAVHAGRAIRYLTGTMRLFNPPAFQGSLRRRRYFEGWYCKQVTPPSAAGTRSTLALIPAVSLGNDPHTFIQVNLATAEGASRSWYLRYRLEEAAFSRNAFEARIGGNLFSTERVELAIDHPTLQLRGTIRYHNPTPFPVSLRHPGIMGPYRYVPRMECYHGVVSAHHRTSGQVQLSGGGPDAVAATLSFAGGVGYIEKDWGRSFPSSWIWMQGNCFEEEGSFMLSVARIPWMGSSFVGFLGFWFQHGVYHPFATYNGSRLTLLRVTETAVQVQIKGPRFDYELLAHRDDGAELIAPQDGAMARTMKESVAASIRLTVREGGTVVFEGSSASAGLEVGGDPGELGAMRD